MELRKYQIDAIEAARNDLRTCRAIILKLATGTGKTIIASGIVKSAVSKGKRVLFLAHTDELVFQAGDKISKAAGVDYAKEKAADRAHDTIFPLVIGSVQSMTRRLDMYPRDFFDLVITDECHRGAADGYVRIFDHFEPAKLIGVTATPFRSDEKALADVFDKVSFDYGLDKAIEDGWLCPIVSETIPLEIDLSGVHISGGDYKKGELAEAIEPMMEQVADKLVEKAMGRKLCVFLPVVSASQKFAQILRSRGFDAEHVDGKSEDRSGIIERFEHKGPGSAICNSALLTEGWDSPSVDCVVDLTPTRSTLRYIQKIGRGTRLHPGKEDLYVPDFLWHGANHNLCHPACLVAKTPEVADKMVDLLAEGGANNIQEVAKQAHKSLVSEREEVLANNLRSFVGAKSKKFDPVLQSISLIDDTLVDWKPETKNEAAPATENQIRLLERHGFDATGWKAGYANRVLEVVDWRFEQNLATPKQVRCLLRNGHPRAQNYTREQANDAMDALSKRWDKMSKNKKRR